MEKLGVVLPRGTRARDTGVGLVIKQYALIAGHSAKLHHVLPNRLELPPHVAPIEPFCEEPFEEPNEASDDFGIFESRSDHDFPTWPVVVEYFAHVIEIPLEPRHRLTNQPGWSSKSCHGCAEEGLVTHASSSNRVIIDVMAQLSHTLERRDVLERR